MGRRDTCVGLDLGQDSVKAVWARGGTRPRILKAELLHIPATAPNRLGVIRPWIEKMGIARHPCALSVRGSDCMFQPLFLPPADPRTPEQAATVEAGRFGEMSEEEMVYGSAPFATGSNETRRLLLVMARPSVLHNILGNAKALGLNVVDMLPGAAAAYRAAQCAGEDDEEPLLLINVGASMTELAVTVKGGIMFARSFAAGGQMFTDAMARELQLLPSRAETLKTSGTGLVGDTPTAAAMRKAGDLWLAELESCLTVFRSIFSASGDQPRRAVLCGGTARMAGLSEIVAQRLGIPTTRIKPPGKGVDEDDAPIFMTAAGLALCGVDVGMSGLALLPPSMRDELVFKRQKPFWIAAGIVAALILAVSLVGGYRDFKRKEEVLNAQGQSLRRRQDLVAQIEQVRGAATEIVDMAAPIERMLLAGSRLRDLITLVSESLSEQDRITLICDAESYFTGLPKEEEAERLGRRGRRRDKKEAPSRRDPFERIVIEGYTRNEDLLLVKELLAKLVASELVVSGDLLSDDKLVSWGVVPVDPPPGAKTFVLDVQMNGIERDET